MPGDARQVIARAASGDDREGLEIADDILADLAAHGLRIVADGQAVIGGEVVTLDGPREKVRSFGVSAGSTSTWVWEASQVTPLGVHPNDATAAGEAS